MVYKSILSMTRFQMMTVGSIRIVPTATLVDRIASPLLYLLPREKEARDMGKDAINTAALPGSSSLFGTINKKQKKQDERREEKIENQEIGDDVFMSVPRMTVL